MSPVRIGSGALRGRRPVAGRPVRNGKVAGSNPAGSTTCGMPPRGSADIPRNDVTSRRRALRGIRRQRPPAGRARDGGAGRPVNGPARADVVQRQHACFPSRRPRVRIPSSALSGSIGFRCVPSPDSVPGGPGDARTPGAGRQYAPYAPLVQRSEQRTFNPRATGPNPVGGTTPGRRPGVSAPIYQRIGCGRFPPAGRETGRKPCRHGIPGKGL